LIHYGNTTAGVNLLQGQKSYGTTQEELAALYNDVEATLEYRFASVIQKLTTRQRPLVGYLLGNGEGWGYNVNDVVQTLIRNYEFDTVNIRKIPYIPSDFRALVILGPGRAALLASTAPLFTAVIAWPLLGERLGPLALIGMAMTLGGVWWVLAARSAARHDHVEGSAAIGVLAGLLGALGQAGGYVLSKIALRSGLDPLSATMVRVTSACAAIWLLATFEGATVRTLATLQDRRGAAFMLAGAVCGPFLGVTLSLAALHWIPTGIAASITAIYPIFTILLAARFHGEALTWRIVGGAIVAVAGVVVLFLR